MEDVIEALRELCIAQTVVLDPPTMDDIVTVEEQILIGVPREMKSFILEVSDVVYGGIEPVTVNDPQAHTYLAEVTAQAWDDGVPRYLIPLCAKFNDEVGRYDYYCVPESGEVVLWSDGELTGNEWSDVWQWAWEVWLGY